MDSSKKHTPYAYWKGHIISFHIVRGSVWAAIVWYYTAQKLQEACSISPM